MVGPIHSSKEHTFKRPKTSTETDGRICRDIAARTSVPVFSGITERDVHYLQRSARWPKNEAAAPSGMQLCRTDADFRKNWVLAGSTEVSSDSCLPEIIRYRFADHS